MSRRVGSTRVVASIAAAVLVIGAAQAATAATTSDGSAAGQPSRGATAAANVASPVDQATAARAQSVTAAPASDPLGTGLGKTPPMGWNDWNAFGCDVDADLIKQTADAMVANGMKAAGYTYVNIDDCWQTHERDADGNLVPDPEKFPHGISAVADYVHSKGLKLGIYEDAGTATCAGYPGSLGHEKQDAATFASWGVDYLKYDNCNNAGSSTRQQYIDRYTAMRDALKATGRPIFFSLCEWGVNDPWTWAPQIGNSWRTTGDIRDSYGSMLSIFHQNVWLYPYAGPGGWNDPDMLEVGNGGMTTTEYRAEFSLWAAMNAPLLAGTDLRTISDEDLAIYTNRDVIAVNQDPLGKQAVPIANNGEPAGNNGLWVLSKPLANGDRAVVLFNSTGAPTTISTTAAEVGMQRSHAYGLFDLWSKKRTETAGDITAMVPAHGVVMYRVSNHVRGSVPPNVSVGIDGLDSTGTPGTPTTVTVTATDNGVRSLRSVSLELSAPDDWTVTPTSRTSFDRVRAGQSVHATFRVVEPEPNAPFQSDTVTASATYAWRGHESDSTSVSTVVTSNSPVQEPYRTFASTDATFGQAGDQLGIRGDGADTYGTTNEYGAIYLPGAEHDGSTVTVKVASQQNTSDWAKAGIMVRNDITDADHSAGFVILVVTPGHGYALQWDSDGNGTLDSNSAPDDQGTGTAVYPSWLRLERDGTSYTGSYSTNGTDWTEIATVSVPSAHATQDVGVFSTSHSSGTIGESEFSGFTVS